MKKIIITGYVGQDPELRVDQKDSMFITFSVGVSVGTKEKPKTDWVNVICNNKVAEIARDFVKKGTRLLIEGFPSVSAYINNESNPVEVLKIHAYNLEFLNKKDDNENIINESSHSLTENVDCNENNI